MAAHRRRIRVAGSALGLAIHKAACGAVAHAAAARTALTALAAGETCRQSRIGTIGEGGQRVDLRAARIEQALGRTGVVHARIAVHADKRAHGNSAGRRVIAGVVAELAAARASHSARIGHASHAGHTAHAGGVAAAAAARGSAAATAAAIACGIGGHAVGAGRKQRARGQRGKSSKSQR